MKLHPQDSDLEANFWTEHTWRGAISDARTIWRWQLEQLLGPDHVGSDQELVFRWARRQSLANRLRGWMYVVRECGWLGSIAHWPRWLRHSLYSSPRNLAYAAGSELLFALADQVQDADIESFAIKTELPLRTAAAASGWRQLAADISNSYHRFVENTRA